MNITQEKIDDLNAILKVKVVENDYLPKVETSLKNYQKKASIPGFRPGKVPSGMLKKMYGKSILIDEINKLLSDSVYKYITENKLEILGNPLPKPEKENEIDWDNQKEFEFQYEMGLSPKFTIDISSNDKFEYKTIKVDDDLVKKYVSDIAKRYGKVENTEISAEGDLLNGDFVEVNENGEIIPGGIFKTSSVFIDRLSENIKKSFINLKVGDKVVVNAKQLTENVVDLANMLGIEKENAENLNCKVQFTVKFISRLKEAEINQELFDKIYGPDTIKSKEEFENKIKSELAAMFVNDSDKKFYNEVVDHLMAKIKFDLPDGFLKKWIQTVNEKPITPEQIETEYENYSKGLKWQLIENKLIKDNNITVSNEEVIQHTKALIQDQYAKMGQIDLKDEDLTQTANKILANEQEAKRIFEQLYGRKVMELFKTKFNITNKELSYDEFFKS